MVSAAIMKDPTTDPAEKCTPEPQKKKLKQARLPFQLLSPGVKNPVTPSQVDRKRKASDTLDDKNVILESADVKENNVSQVEKKPKITNKDSDPVSDVNSSENDSDKMEVDDIKQVTESATSKDSSQKTTTAVTPKPQSGRPRKNPNPTPSEKSNGKIKGKVGTRKTKKNNSKTLISKSSTSSVAVVDLTDSPKKCEQESSNLATGSPTLVINSENNTVQTDKELPNNPEGNKVVDGLVGKKDSPVEDPNTHVQVTDDKKSHVIKKLADIEPPEIKNKSRPSSLDGKKSNTTVTKKSLSNKETLKQSSIVNLISKISPKAETSSNNSVEVINQTSNENDSASEHLDDFSKACDVPKTSTAQSTTDETKFHSPASGSSNSPSSSQAPSSATPLSSKKPANRKLTPKQLLKLKEKEERMKEKERLKEEKERKKAEEKQAKEEEKLRLKQEKEEEKRKEKEEKEKKKLAELEQKNEEKRLKEEEKRLKEEERLAKTEEKRIKEEEEKKKKEEKKQIEEKKEAVKRKSMQAFASFFVKSEAKSVQVEEEKENTKINSYFKSFEVKADMRLAPLVRRQLSDECKQDLERAVEEAVQSPRTYLDQLHSPSYKKRFDTKTWPALDDTDDDIIFIESEKADEEMETDIVPEKKPEKKRHKAKLLQFHENRRPPYWGTWRKKSKFILPKLPFIQDKTMLEYEVDSDDEWEEPEDGESLRGSEDEESQDEQYEEDNDMFVPHGYLSDGEGDDDFDDTSPETMKAKLKFLQMEFEAERNEKQEKLKPHLIGCVWFCNSESEASSVGSRIAELFLTRKAVWEGSLPISLSAPLSSSPSTTHDSTDQTSASTETKDSRGARRKLVNESMIPDIIKKVHGSRKKLSRLLNEILDEQADKINNPSKKCLAEKIREIALWEKTDDFNRHYWYVKNEVRAAHGLSDLIIKPVAPPPSATPKTNITKFTKVLTSDERLKLLRELPSSLASPNNGQTSPVTSQSSKTSMKPRNLSVIPSTTGEKKRVPILVSVPPGHQLPKKSSTLLNFMQTTSKTTPSKEKLPSSNDENKQNDEKPEEKLKTNEKISDRNHSNWIKSSPVVSNEKNVKKRITPITLTTLVSKNILPQKPSSEEECIVLSD